MIRARALLSRRHWLALVAVASVVAASVQADLEPARIESWRLPKASLYAVTANGGGAWAVGYWGTVLRSSDAGRTWVQTDTPTSKTLFGVSFAGDTNGWVVGASGTILRTTDGGASWKQQPVSIADEMGGSAPLDVNLFGVAAVSPSEAWAVGDLGMILHTTDGETWQKLALDPAVLADDNVPERIFNAVIFTSPTEGWIAGEFATLLRTTDGGVTWVGQRTIEGAPSDLYLFNLAAAPGGPAAAVGLAGSVLVSTDGGAVWESRSVDTTAGLFAIAWRGEQGLAVGDRGVLFVTQDGGRTWTESKRPKQIFNWLAGAAFAHDGSALVVGEGGLVLRSDDRGASFAAATTPTVPVEPTLPQMGGEAKGQER